MIAGQRALVPPEPRQATDQFGNQLRNQIAIPVASRKGVLQPDQKPPNLLVNLTRAERFGDFSALISRVL